MVDDGTVVGRVAAILDAVASASGPLPLAELTRRTGIPKPTVRRIAASLVSRGLLNRADDGYVPGGTLARYGLHALARHPAALAAQPVLADLRQRAPGGIAWLSTVHGGALTLTGATCGREHHAAIRARWPTAELIGSSVVLVAGCRLEIAHQPERAARILSAGWRRLTPYSVTDPRRMRSLLAEARDTGVAREDEQTRLGWSCLAAVLRGPGGAVTGILGIAGRTGSLAAPALRAALVRQAADLEAELRATGLPQEALPAGH
ncbi:helix-turn-helix domain-containing protein [Microbispora sp. NPDC046933]|uniref:IclR family transcriptional regulator n=1 Tax=Microbispora sp. NPDC046933 TaxID=3155618 RepID=UPI0033F540D7